jgi:hypothetical protein
MRNVRGLYRRSPRAMSPKVLRDTGTADGHLLVSVEEPEGILTTYARLARERKLVRPERSIRSRFDADVHRERPDNRVSPTAFKPWRTARF